MKSLETSDASPWSREAHERLQKDLDDEAKESITERSIVNEHFALGSRDAATPGLDFAQESGDLLLREHVSVRQRPEEGFRKYFMDDYFRLWVWYEHNGLDIKGFQLLYGDVESERAITWHREGTFSHHGVTEEGSAGGAKMSQVLGGNVEAIKPIVLVRFREHSLKIDRKIADLVVAVIMQKTGITQTMMIDAGRRRYDGRDMSETVIKTAPRKQKHKQREHE